MTTEQLLKKFSGIIKTSNDIRAAEGLLETIKSILPEDTNNARTYNRELLSFTGRQRGESHDSNTLDRLYELRKKSLLIDAPACFDSYLQYIEWDREPEKKFYLPRRKILKTVVDEMQRLDDDTLDLLTVSLPPGVGKSTLNILYLTWIMGKYPDQPNLVSAHSDKLTRSFYDGVLSIITDPEYLWADVFPTVKLSGTNAKDESIDLGKAKRFKTLTCRSIDGSLTGATRCERVLAADDLVSGIEEAMSKSRMDSLWDKYTNDLKSRKKQGCKEIHIATRWSVQDPIGRLERQYSGDSRARFIAIPALNANGESNFNYNGGVGFDTKYFLDMKDTLDDVSWRCLFQNEPIEREGILYQEDELLRYFELPDGEPDAVISVCDTKDTGKDFQFMPIAYKFGDRYFIDDCVCNNYAIEILDVQCSEMLVKNKVKWCQFESNAAGGRVADRVLSMVKEKGGFTHITKKFTTANKETKILVNSPFVKEHFYFKDESTYRKDSDYARMINFLCGYTLAGKNKHDDVPDGMAQLVEFVQSFGGGRTEIFKRPF